MKKYSGIKITPEGKCAELMLPLNGLSNQKSALPEGGSPSDWGAALSGLRLLQSVNLHGNKLEGNLEAALARACVRTTADQFLKRPCHFEALRNIDLCRNAFTGPFPRTLLEVPTLEWLNFSRNALTGPLPDDVSKLKALKLLDVSHNLLGGQLPARGLRTLRKLQCLNLSHNDLAGKVNPDFSRLTSLVVLNLGQNKFTGKLPGALSTLTDLKKLDCRGNRCVYDSALTHSSSLQNEHAVAGPVLCCILRFSFQSARDPCTFYVFALFLCSCVGACGAV
jgi:Leucine-rich repeat (LRR) protein